MKRNILISLLVVLSLFLLVGCGGEEKKQIGGAFIGGTQGLVASFEPLSILEDGVYTIFDTDDFPIEVVLKNKGEQELDIGHATLKLIGPPQTAFENIPEWTLKNTQKIEKISEFNLEGGEEIISFTPIARGMYKEEVTGFTDITWNLELSYDYKTHLIIDDVCFKGDVTNNKICEVKESKKTSVSAAPIIVSAVAEDVGGKGIVLLKIDVNDAGLGEATIIGKEFDRRFDQISFTIDEPDKWKCTSGGREGEARLIDGKAQIVCRLKTPLGESELYVKPVRLTMDYTYKELLTEKMRVKESAK